MRITEISSKSALHFHQKGYATNWDINTFRGCMHKCVYCFAQYSHKYLNSDKFFDEILVKTNIVQALERDLSNKNWKYLPVNAGGVTDCYQPIEKKYQLMPQIISLFIKYKNPLIITTKSTLILRDIKLLSKLNEVAGIKLFISASTFDESIRQKIEPCAPPTVDRINMLKYFSEVGISSTILLMPIIPYINDSLTNFEKIFQLAHNNKVSNILHACLYLRGQTKKYFFKFIKKQFPEVENLIYALYNGSYVCKEYSQHVANQINKLRKRYNMFHKDMELTSPNKILQLNLFESDSRNISAPNERNFASKLSYPRSK